MLIINLKIKQLITNLQDVQVLRTLFECHTDIELHVPGFQVLEVVQTEYNKSIISHEHGQRNLRKNDSVL